MNVEFSTIPANITDAMSALSSTLINAGSSISGNTTTYQKTDNSKSYNINLNQTSGESGDELLTRLDILLKTS